MNVGAKVLVDVVPLSADVGAEHFSSAVEGQSPQVDYLLSFLLGCLVAGALLATGSSVLTLLG